MVAVNTCKGEDKSSGQWPTKSVCRHLFWESCDIQARNPKYDQTFNHYRDRVRKPEFANFSDPAFRTRAKKIAVEFYDYFDKLGVELWPAFGTALGMVRDNDFIPHDNDVDFGFLCKDMDKVVNGLDELHDGLNDFIVIRNQHGSIFTIFNDNVMIDMYSFEKLDGHQALYQGHRMFYNHMVDEVLPFKTFEFEGKEYRFMNNPEAFFARYYGPDWRTPK